MKTKVKPTILNKGSLLTYKDGDKEFHLNYLFAFEGHGIYEPNLGMVDVTKEEAETHNKLLSDGEISGLDTCEIGMGRNFYPSKDRKTVSTWASGLVSKDVTVNGQVITFRRKGRTFSGRLRKHDESVFFKRIS